MASFVWKPAHFEFRGYGGVWDEVQIAFVENYTLILWFLAIIGVKVLGKSAFVNVFCLVQLISCLDRQSKFKMFTLFFQLPYWWTKEVLQHGTSIIGFIILRGSFWWISQLWDNAHTLNLENCLLYLWSIISQFLDFMHWMVFDFICQCDNAHTLLWTNNKTSIPIFASMI